MYIFVHSNKPRLDKQMNEPIKISELGLRTVFTWVDTLELFLGSLTQFSSEDFSSRTDQQRQCSGGHINRDKNSPLGNDIDYDDT